jgi:hypothetical protein
MRNERESTQEKNWLTPKKALATALAFGSLAVPLAGCGKVASTPSHTPSPNKTELPSQSPTASPTAEVSPSPSATPEKAPTQQEVDQYASWAEKYSGMGVDEFDALPRAERLAYAQYLMDYTVAHNVYNAMYNDEYSNNGNYKITPTLASPSDTGEQIINNNMYHDQLSHLQLQEPADTPTLNKEKAEEAMSAVYYDVGKNKVVSNAYSDSVDKLGTKLDVIIPTLTALHTSELLNGHDSEGNKVQYKIIKIHDNYNPNAMPADPYAGKTMFAEFGYVTFKSYDGSEKSIWLLDMVSTSMDGLKATATIK